jgi:hypothetical protein
MVPVLRQAAAGLQILEAKEHSFYLVDVGEFVALSMSFDSFVRRLSRRGNWRHVGYYAGLCVRALAVKLQRVGIETNLIAPANNEILSAVNYELPAVICNLIDQFGIKVDVTMVSLSPYVTDDLIAYLATISYNMLDNNSADYAASIVPANYKNATAACYGALINDNVFWSIVAAELNVPFNCGDNSNALGVQVGNLLNTARRTNGLVYATVPHLQGISDQLAGPPTNGYLTQSLPAAPAAFPGTFVAFTNAITTARSILAVDPSLPAPVDPVGAGLQPLNTCRVVFDVDQVTYEMQELAQHYTTRAISTAASGSFSPLVVSSGGDDVSGSCAVRGVTPQEYVLGLILNQKCPYVDRTGLPFNVGPLRARRARYSCEPVGQSTRELRASLWRQGLLKY